MDIDFTPRNVVKYVVKTAIYLKVSERAAEAMTDYTCLEEDSITVKLGSKVIGWAVADTAKPYTDKLVDKTANFINAKREARKARKSQKDQTPTS